MSEETIIGPQRCHQCGGEYGEHDSGCTESKEHKELTRLRDELATARSERDEWKRSAEGYNAEWLAARRELDESRRTVERLRADAESWNHSFHETNSERLRLRAALEKVQPLLAGQPAQWVTDALRVGVATGPAAQQQVAATPSAEPVVPEGELLLQLVAMTNQAEALARELEWLLAYQARTPNNSRARDAVAAFRTIHPPAEATAKMP